MDPSKFTVEQLKSELRKLSLPVSGRKAVLVERYKAAVSTNETTTTAASKKVTKKIIPTKPIKKEIYSDDSDEEEEEEEAPRRPKAKETKKPPLKKIIPTRPIKKEIYSDNSDEEEEEPPKPLFAAQKKDFGSNPVAWSYDDGLKRKLEDEIPEKAEIRINSRANNIIGNKENENTLKNLLSQGFITENEYQQRLGSLNVDITEISSLTSKLNNVAVGQTRVLTPKLIAEWQALVEASADAISYHKHMPAVMQTLKEVNENSLLAIENFEKACSLLASLYNDDCSGLSKYFAEMVDALIAVFRTVHQRNYLIAASSVIDKFGYSRDFKQAIINKNIFVECMALTEKFKSDWAVVYSLCTVVRRLTIASPKYSNKWELLQFLCDLLIHGDQNPKLLNEILWAISSIIFDLSLLDQFFKIPFILEQLCALFDVPVCSHAVSRIYVNISAGPDSATTKLIEVGVLDAVVSAIRMTADQERKSEFLKDCWYFVGNVAGVNDISVFKSFLDLQIVPIITNKIVSAPTSVQDQIIWCIANLFLFSDISYSPSSYFEDISLFTALLQVLHEEAIEEGSLSHFRKALGSFKTNILPQLSFEDDSVITALFETV